MSYRDKHEIMGKMKLDARKILDKYSYKELMTACDENIGPIELLECLRDIFLSIIEDWIQSNVNERERKHDMENINI